MTEVCLKAQRKEALRRDRKKRGEEGEIEAPRAA